MKTTPGLMLLAAGLSMAGWIVMGAPESAQNPEIRAQLKSFVAEKENQARSLASAGGQELPPEVQSFFSAVQSGDWESASNDFAKAEYFLYQGKTNRKGWWQPVLETYGVEQFNLGDEKYAAAYGDGIIQSIPSGSIYFGGTDEGRFIVTAMEKSQIDGKPFFTLTQNALADNAYLDYLRSTYGSQIYIPTAADSQKSFDDYLADVQQRMENHQLEPGEMVTTDPVTGKMEVKGQVAVMGINALLAKTIFDKEPGREFYVEESYPLKWMYPYLEPHGLIFKLNREPLDKLPKDVVQRDHDYWTKTITPMIGDWLGENTSISDVTAFNEKVFLHHDFSNFTGDTNFVLNDAARSMFSKERSSIASLYAWRMKQADNILEKARMARAADFAFRQAWALSPDSVEVVFRYVQFLMDGNRHSDALIVAESAAKFPNASESIKAMAVQLKKFQQPGN